MSKFLNMEKQVHILKLFFFTKHREIPLFHCSIIVENILSSNWELHGPN